MVGEEILACLAAVAEQRAARVQDGALGARVVVVKAYQHARFVQSYADLLADQRYGGAARFFLDDLYGPGDFSTRDDQFARVVPGLVRVFPRDIVDTVLSLGRLHALSERLDTAMGRVLLEVGSAGRVNGGTYGACWRRAATEEEREQQIGLMVQVGQSLDGYTRNPLLRHSLRLMRGPATVAGLGALQTFLERGFDTFRAMRGAREFLDTIARRERALAAALFAGQAGPECGCDGVTISSVVDD